MIAEASIHIADLRAALRRPRTRRGAMTLVEVMVVCTLLAAVAGVAVTLLAAVKRWDNRLRDHGLQTDQVLRLAESVRDDIRQGTNVMLPKADTLVVELADGGRVSYELEADACRRTSAGGGGAVQATDRFAIGPARHWKLDQSTTGRRPLVAVELQRAEQVGQTDSGRLPLVVYGALGADRASQE